MRFIKNEQLIRAASKGDLEKVNSLLGKEANVNASGLFSGETPLIEAAAHGHSEIVKLLIRAGAKVDQPGKMVGNTALIIAAEKGYPEIVRILLEHGADLAQQTKDMTDRNKIAAIYNLGTDYEYQRLTQSPVHEAEFELTADLLKEYICPETSVLDIGAGPGRYAEYLLKELNCNVGLVDLAEDSLEAFTHRIDAKYGHRVIFTKTSCATELDWVDDCSFDIVLLMGPLYHLLETEERQAAIEHCLRILKLGGYIFAAFISPYAKYARLLKNGAKRLQDSDYLEKLMQQGQTQYVYEHLVVGQFRCWPTQARRMMEAGGFETIRLRNLEGVGSFLSEEEKETLQNPVLKQAWFDILRATCENPDLLGATLHFLYVGQKI